MGDLSHAFNDCLQIDTPSVNSVLSVYKAAIARTHMIHLHNMTFYF